MKKCLKALLALCMMFGMTACGSSSSSSSDTASFKIGGSGPLSGDYAIYGKAVENAAKLAVAEINETEGYDFFELKMEDDQGDPEQSPTCYATLKDWGMQVGLSTVTSGAAAAVSQLYVDDETFALTPSASNTAVVFSDDDCTTSYGNVYQMCFTDPNQGVASADYISSHTDIGTKVAIIYQSDENYSVSIYNKFKSEAKAKGLDVVYTDSFIATDKDFKTQLSKAKAKGADVVFLPIYYSSASLILTQANDMKYSPSFFGVDGMDGILTLDGFDTALAEGVYLLTPFSADSTDEKTSAFVSNYKEEYGETPNQFAADAYDVVYAIHDALVAGKATPDMSNADITEILKEQFTSMTFDGITGTGVTWKETGEVSKDPKAVVIKDGAYVSVED